MSAASELAAQRGQEITENLARDYALHIANGADRWEAITSLMTDYSYHSPRSVERHLARAREQGQLPPTPRSHQRGPV